MPAGIECQQVKTVTVAYQKLVQSILELMATEIHMEDHREWKEGLA